MRAARRVGTAGDRRHQAPTTRQGASSIAPGNVDVSPMTPSISSNAGSAPRMTAPRPARRSAAPTAAGPGAPSSRGRTRRSMATTVSASRRRCNSSQLTAGRPPDPAGGVPSRRSPDPRPWSRCGSRSPDWCDPVGRPARSPRFAQHPLRRHSGVAVRVQPVGPEARHTLSGSMPAGNCVFTRRCRRWSTRPPRGPRPAPVRCRPVRPRRWLRCGCWPGRGPRGGGRVCTRHRHGSSCLRAEELATVHWSSSATMQSP